jgi:hypothetical protein
MHVTLHALELVRPNEKTRLFADRGSSYWPFGSVGLHTLLEVQTTDCLAKADAYPARRLRRKVSFPERGDLRVQRNSYLEAEVSPLVR